jgi:hypothetical protein
VPVTPAIFNSCLVIAATAVVLLGLFHPRVIRSVTWRATVTPLASIIGSGFLVLAPILMNSFGTWGILVMLLLCTVAYLIGGAVRFNIDCYRVAGERNLVVPAVVRRLETLASYVLALAYVVSINYYLNLFGAFSVSLTTVNDRVHARIVATAAIALIGLLGWLRGFAGLERVEELTVGVKLAMIGGLLVGMLAFSIEQPQVGPLLDSLATNRLTWGSLTVALGLLVTVQGFETSRYLGEEFDASTRIRTMRISQIVSSAIYMLYIGLTILCFSDHQVPDSETAIVSMTALVAPALPAMLVAAALAAQLSAAIADTASCGGLAEELTRQRIGAKVTYVLVGLFGVGLTWMADIYSIIALASRAFAAYYAMQCAIAAIFAARSTTASRFRVACYILLATIAASIVVFGAPAE